MLRVLVRRWLPAWLCLAAVATGTGASTDQRVAITYHVESLRDGASVLRAYSEQQVELLEKLNRSDREHLPRLPSVVVPDVWVADELAYAVLPSWYPSGETYPKLLLVHQPAQVFGAYEFGRLIRWGPVNSGAKTTPTPAGLFFLTWRAKGHTSTINPEWFMPWYFNFENRLGLSFHEFALEGRPASHACIRLLNRDARWLFDWGEPWTLDAASGQILEWGTPVFVVGQYDFEAPPPWAAVERLAADVALPAMPVPAARE